jgi:hypothetical protein
MERVTEEYNSGRSDNSTTAGNLLFAPFSDTAAKKVKKNIVANNRRSYTRKRTVWKCLECSGHNDHYRKIVSKDIAKAIKAVHKAQKGGLFSKPRVVSDECLAYLEEIKDREGKTGTILTKDLLAKIEASIADSPVQQEGEAAASPIEASIADSPAQQEGEASALALIRKQVEEKVEEKHAKGLQPLAWYYKFFCWFGIFYGAFFLIALAGGISSGEATMTQVVSIGLMSAACLYPSIKALYFRPYNTEARKVARELRRSL